MTNLDTLQPLDPVEQERLKGRVAALVGLTEDCPISKYRLGPVTICKESFGIVRDGKGNPRTDDQTGLTKIKHRDGKVEILTPKEWLHIVSRAMKVAVRKIPLEPRMDEQGQPVEGRFRAFGVKMYQKEQQYTPKGDDTLLSDYLYLISPAESGAYGGSERFPTITEKGKPSLSTFAKKAVGESRSKTKVEPKREAGKTG